jgi:hypothetical protein
MAGSPAEPAAPPGQPSRTIWSAADRCSTVTSKLVAVASAVTERAAPPLDWFSMPVPLSRDDDAYFEPLADLRRSDRTRLLEIQAQVRV